MSLLTTSPKPAKLKGFLASVKEQILNPLDQAEEDSQLEISTTVLGILLIRMELVQRGVLLNNVPLLPNGSNDEIDISKVWEAVRMAAGKALLDQASELPNPLLAGSSAIAGKVAEQIAKRQQQTSSVALIPSENRDVLQSVVTRCKEVQDDRLWTLLQLLVMDDTTCPVNTMDGDASDLSKMMSLYQISQGYYLQAASFQPNAPPMWKKAWDVQIEMQKIRYDGDEESSMSEHLAQPSESSFPLMQLIRIAASKDNTKRVSELALHLSESYLTAASCSTNSTAETEPHKNSIKEAQQLIPQSFIEPYLDASTKSHCGNLSDSAEKASQAIQQCSPEQLHALENSSEALFWYDLLKFRIALARQDGQIQQRAQEMYTTSQNRASGSLSNSTKSMDTCLKIAKKDVLSEAAVAMDTAGGVDSDKGQNVHDAALLLLHTLLERIENHGKELAPLDFTALDLIRTYMVRLQHQARSVGLVMLSNTKKKKKSASSTKTESSANIANDYEMSITSWSRLLQFLYPILRQAQKSSGLGNIQLQTWLSTISKRERQLLSSTATIFVSVVWIILPVLCCVTSEVLPTISMLLKAIFHDDLINFASNVLSGLLLQLEQEKRDRDQTKTTAVVQTVITDLEKGIERLKAAQATSLSMVSVGLTSLTSTASARWHQQRILVQEAISWHRKSQSSISSSSKQLSPIETMRLSHEGEFGIAFCQCMIAWSGLHSLPWSTCTISDARLLVVKAHDALERATIDWGRSSPDFASGCLSLERLLLELANADIMFESGGAGAPIPCLLDASSATSSTSKGVEPSMARYMAILGSIDVMSKSGATVGVFYATEEIALLRIHCIYGLARIASRTLKPVESLQSAEAYALKGLELAIDSLNAMGVTEYNDEIVRNASIWTCPKVESGTASFRYQVSAGRRLVANALIRSGRFEQAKSILMDAVNDAPMDSEAALSLGAYLLRRILYHGNDHSPPTAEEAKGAQIQLLKAAKLDSSKADPFALLGLWFERQQDMKRAQGCYSKALALDPPNPVAGRGLLRVFKREQMEQQELDAYLDAAINANSSVNGWAWRAVGERKVAVENQDELAVVALNKALRCRDIESRQLEPLVVFYSMPDMRESEADSADTSHQSSNSEKADILAELAMCYRRLGRYTAAIRSFYSASEVAGERVSSSVLFSCAQVELELGLFDEAAENYLKVLNRQETRTHAIAAYGQGVALLAIAQRDSQDGKAGAALDHVRRAIQGCLTLNEPYSCVRKLLGDLYSFGATLPPDTFIGETDKESEVSGMDLLRTQLQFIAMGEEAYRSAANLQVQEGDLDVARACIVCDIGANILLQGERLSMILGAGEGSDSSSISGIPEVADSYCQAAQEFRNAIELVPLYAPAWCGLGCAVATSDPLLSQHALCRCLELDKMFADSYANLGFLYVSHDAMSASETVMDSLTQVADTPFMWINRALMLERSAIAHVTKDMAEAGRKINRAADAYRAALQVMKHPSAMLGLSLTGRIDVQHDSLMRKDGYSHMLEYVGMAGSTNRAAATFCGVMALEKGATTTTMWNKDLIQSGLAIVSSSVAPGDLNDTLNLDAIGKSMESSEMVQEDQTNDLKNTNDSTELSIQQKIVLDPTSPDLWLSLTKELVKAGSMKQASSAADRASTMLKRQLIVPPKIGGSSPAVVDASVVSEAVSLAYWLRQSSGDHSDGEGGQSAYDLQFALMMCPNDPLSRKALRLSSAT